MENPVTKAVQSDKARLCGEIGKAATHANEALLQYQQGLISASELFWALEAATINGRAALIRLGDYAQQGR